MWEQFTSYVPIKEVILLGFGLTLLLVTIRRLRYYRLKERYTILFLLLATPFILLALYPRAVGVIARWLNIEYSTVALLAVTALFLILILELLTIVSVQDRKIQTLAQMVALLQNQTQGQGNRPAEPAHAPPARNPDLK